MTSTLVYCVRHGQTAENLRGIIQGQLDTQLDETGIEQATTVAYALKDVGFDVGFTSDLARAVNTAKAIMEYHDGVPLRKLSILRERNMGNLQGQPAFQRGKRPPLDVTVETSPAFVERTLQFWDETVTPHAKKASELQGDRQSCMLVVGHGAFISTLARALIGHRDIVKAPEVMLSWCPNTSVTLVEVQSDGTGSLRRFGDISHLAKPVVVANADELKEVNGLYSPRNK